MADLHLYWRARLDIMLFETDLDASAQLSCHSVLASGADFHQHQIVHFLPAHRLTAYRERLAPHQPGLPVTERAGAEVLSLPFSPAHSDDDVRDAIAALRRVHARFSG